MKKEELKEKFHKYIDEATEEELEEMMYLLEEDNADYKIEGKVQNWWEDDELVKEFERRVDDVESGKVRGIPFEEVKQEIADMLEKMKK